MHPLKAPSGNQCFHILPSPQGRPSVPASWDSPNPFDSALPCSNPLPSAGQAGVTCSDLSGLSCLPLPPPPPPPTSQLPCCYQAVASEVSQGPGGHWRHLALLRSRSLQHQGLPPRRTACDSLSLSQLARLPPARPHGACHRTPWEWRWVGARGPWSPSPSFLFLLSAPAAWAHRRQLSDIIQEPICND